MGKGRYGPGKGGRGGYKCSKWKMYSAFSATLWDREEKHTVLVSETITGMTKPQQMEWHTLKMPEEQPAQQCCKRRFAATFSFSYCCSINSHSQKHYTACLLTSYCVCILKMILIVFLHLEHPPYRICLALQDRKCNYAGRKPTPNQN